MLKPLHDLIEKLYSEMNPTSAVLIGIAIMLFASFLMTRLTKLAKLPNVTAYIFTGVIIGPYVLNLIKPDLIDGMDFLTDIALAFIAFGVGRFLRLEALKRGGKKILIITLFESMLASVLVFLGMYFIFGLNLEFSLLLAAIASATAPASTMMTIRQTRAKGHFVETILQVVSLDDAISLILFSVSIAIMTASHSEGAINFWHIAMPILLNLAVVVAGFISGYILHLLITTKRTTDNKLIIAIATIMLFTGVAATLGISPLLGGMAMGMAYINFSNDEGLFKQLDYFSPPILSLFYVLSGMRLDLTILLGLVGAGVAYFLIRIIGKYAGASLGSYLAKSTPENIKYLGLALIPQAGVSIGLAALGSRTLIEYGLVNEAALLTTIIIASGILYEIFGPVSAKLSLYLSGSYEVEKKPPKRPKKKLRNKSIENNE
ncbi:MAG: cation:proton antiporter [Acholeplasmataceae bacterium]